MPNRFSVDAAVVGAGTAGAGAALQLARRGFSVVLLERRSADAGGAQWHNGVLDRHFVRAGIEPPSGAERYAAHGVTHLVGPDGTRAVTITSPTVTADMGLLGRRLRRSFVEAGGAIVDRAEHLRVEVRRGRLTAVDALRRSHGSGPDHAVRIEAPLFVDATGRRGLLRQHAPALAPWCPTVRGAELCSAADFHFRVDDPDGARRFLARYGARPGETVTVVGPNGGFSTRAVSVNGDLDRVAVLVGCLATGRYGTGPRMLDELRAAEPWIGDAISGGYGVIPLRRPYARFTAPGLALVGDAACQVFPAHGSGIGLGLIAGRLLAEAVDGADDPGDEATLWRYQAAFHHELGGVLVSSDVFRRMSTAIGSAGVEALVRSGLMTETSAHAGLDQQWPRPPTAELVALAGRMARAPGLARRMLPSLARAQLAGGVGRRHPGSPDLAALRIWDRGVERLLGPLPT